MVESRMLYVGKEERMIAVRNIFALYKKYHVQHPPPPVPPEEHTDPSIVC